MCGWEGDIQVCRDQLRWMWHVRVICLWIGQIQSSMLSIIKTSCELVLYSLQSAHLLVESQMKMYFPLQIPRRKNKFFFVDIRSQLPASQGSLLKVTTWEYQLGAILLARDTAAGHSGCWRVSLTSDDFRTAPHPCQWHVCNGKWTNCPLSLYLGLTLSPQQK